MNAPTKQDYTLAREIIGPYVVATSAEIHKAAVRIAAHRVAAVRRGNADLNRKLDQILTDAKYEGGVQYWIRKHDDLMLAFLGGKRSRKRKA